MVKPASPGRSSTVLGSCSSGGSGMHRSADVSNIICLTASCSVFKKGVEGERSSSPRRGLAANFKQLSSLS